MAIRFSILVCVCAFLIPSLAASAVFQDAHYCVGKQETYDFSLGSEAGYYWTMRESAPPGVVVVAVVPASRTSETGEFSLTLRFDQEGTKVVTVVFTKEPVGQQVIKTATFTICAEPGISGGINKNYRWAHRDEERITLSAWGTDEDCVDGKPDGQNHIDLVLLQATGA